MRALVLHDLTGPEALRLEDLPEPEAPEGTVAIEVHAAGLGFVDRLVTRGEYQIRLPLRHTDVVGVNYGGMVAVDQASPQAAWQDLRWWFAEGHLPVPGVSEHPLAHVPDVLRALGERRLSSKPVATVR